MLPARAERKQPIWLYVTYLRHAGDWGMTFLLVQTPERRAVRGYENNVASRQKSVMRYVVSFADTVISQVCIFIKRIQLKTKMTDRKDIKIRVIIPHFLLSLKESCSNKL